MNKLVQQVVADAHTVIFIIVIDMSFQYTYDTISALIFAYKAAGSTPATGRMAVLHIYTKRGEVDTGVDSNC